MKLEVINYRAIHLSRLSDARAVHLHPTQTSSEIVEIQNDRNIEVHAWDVNGLQELEKVANLNIPQV